MPVALSVQVDIGGSGSGGSLLQQLGERDSIAEGGIGFFPFPHELVGAGQSRRGCAVAREEEVGQTKIGPRLMVKYEREREREKLYVMERNGEKRGIELDFW